MLRQSYHALIRTHHITSRKKIAVLKAAAKQLDCYVLLRSGGVPGIMYVEGSDKSKVQFWVDTVHKLRYMDYQLVSPIVQAESGDKGFSVSSGTLEEVSSVKDIGAAMDRQGMTSWWRHSMGYSDT